MHFLSSFVIFLVILHQMEMCLRVSFRKLNNNLIEQIYRLCFLRVIFKGSYAVIILSTCLIPRKLLYYCITVRLQFKNQRSMRWQKK
jgi:hypothetical protein